jgi:hypothetical protein
LTLSSIDAIAEPHPTKTSTEITSMTTTENQEQTSNIRPASSFQGSGGIHVAVWKNKTENDQDVYSVKIDRRYRDDKDGEFKSTAYLRASDLLRTQKLLDEADAWIEQDKAKSRIANTATSQAR